VFENQWEADRWVPIEKVFSLLIKELGDMHLKATKPDTIGVALNNDPAGLAAYILDTFAFASRADYASQPDGRLYEIFTKDELLTNIMIYWVNNCFTSSARIYKESLPAVFSDFGLVTVPTAALIAKNEIMPLTPTLMKECYSDVVKYTALDKAGHFLALEEPDVVAKDIIEFAEMLRARRAEQPE
jgi:pimeloyl-ACP methyl ester carboxylesterase